MTSLHNSNIYKQKDQFERKPEIQIYIWCSLPLKNKEIKPSWLNFKYFPSLLRSNSKCQSIAKQVCFELPPLAPIMHAYIMPVRHCNGTPACCILYTVYSRVQYRVKRTRHEANCPDRADRPAGMHTFPNA